MAKPDAWMPLYVGDYLGDTSRFTLEEHGAYMLLIMDYWRNGSPPDDDTVIARILGVSATAWKRLAAVRDKFIAVNGRLTHPRIERELANAADKKVSAEEKARAAATARWSKDAPSNAPSMPQALLEAMPEAMLERCPSPSPSPKATSKASPVVPAGFSRFWSAYPSEHRRVDKRLCITAWNRDGLELVADQIVAHVGMMANTREWRDGYEPAPLRYLKNRRWEDGVPVTKKREAAL